MDTMSTEQIDAKIAAISEEISQLRITRNELVRKLGSVLIYGEELAKEMLLDELLFTDGVTNSFEHNGELSRVDIVLDDEYRLNFVTSKTDNYYMKLFVVTVGDGKLSCKLESSAKEIVVHPGDKESVSMLLNAVKIGLYS